jgi:hypothetical protein
MMLQFRNNSIVPSFLLSMTDRMEPEIFSYEIVVV